MEESQHESQRAAAAATADATAPPTDSAETQAAGECVAGEADFVEVDTASTTRENDAHSLSGSSALLSNADLSELVDAAYEMSFDDQAQPEQPPTPPLPSQPAPPLPVQPAPPLAPPRQLEPDSYRTKRVHVFGREVTIVLQNENGPCPLLAIVNALSLKGRLTLPAAPFIAVAELLSMVATLLLEREGDANREASVAGCLSVLPTLTRGLDVNVRFTGVGAYEYTAETTIFDLLDVPLMHGWLIEDDATRAVLGDLSYNALVEMMVSDAPAQRRAAAEEFMAASASQLTRTGLDALCALPPGSLVCLFRNNHFSTAFTRDGALLLLVTDEGYAEEGALVWEPLTLSGAAQFFLTGDFRVFDPSAPSALSSAEAQRLQEEADLETATRLSQQAEGERQANSRAGLSRPLFDAAERGDIHAVLEAISSGLDVNTKDCVGRTALHWAVAEGHAELAELLLQSGAKVNAQDEGGLTPLHVAAATNMLDMVRLLLRERANASLVDGAGNPPFALATAPELRKQLHAHAALHASARQPQPPPQSRPVQRPQPPPPPPPDNNPCVIQ